MPFRLRGGKGQYSDLAPSLGRPPDSCLTTPALASAAASSLEHQGFRTKRWQ